MNFNTEQLDIRFLDMNLHGRFSYRSTNAALIGLVDKSTQDI